MFLSRVLWIIFRRMHRLRRYSDRWIQGRRQYFDRFHWRGEKDTLPASLTEKNVRTWLPPVARLKV